MERFVPYLVALLVFGYFVFAVGRAIDSEFAPIVRSHTEQLDQLDR